MYNLYVMMIYILMITFIFFYISKITHNPINPNNLRKPKNTKITNTIKNIIFEVIKYYIISNSF